MPGLRLQPDGCAAYRGLPRWQKVDMGLLEVREGLSVLDIGCGPGYLLGKAAAMAGLSLGVDLDESRLRSTRESFLDGKRPSLGLVGFALADAQCLPLPDASFDRIICTETLEHVPDARLTLREMARVLKPEGRLAVSVPQHLCEAVLCGLIRDYLRFPGGHRRIYTRQSLCRSLAEAGLEPYAEYSRDSLEAVYWILLSLLSRPFPEARFDGALAALERWRARTRAEPYSRFYHAVDEVGNRLLPKSLVVYAIKPC